MKIVLVGYMGSGKTTVGKILSKELGINFLDLDDYIESSLGMTIPDVFKQKGELFFRKKEYEYLKEVLTKKNNFILSTGGGTPCYGDNMNTIIENTADVFYLKVSIPGLIERLSKEKEHRPLIKDLSNEAFPEFIGKHLFERSPFYSQAKHIVVGDNKTPDQITKEIKELLG